MNLSDLERRRKTAGRMAMACCVVFLLAALDGIVSRFREPPEELRLLAGETVMITGPAGDDVKEVGDLEARSDSSAIEVRFEGIYSGFWLGGRMWRAELTVGHSAAQGDYAVSIHTIRDSQARPLSSYRCRVFADAGSLRRSSGSIVQRYLGVSPWVVFGFSLLLTPAAMGAVFLASRKRASLMAEQGQADVYRVVKSEDGSLVFFALGSRHGIQPGTLVWLVSEDGMPLGNAMVTEVDERDAVASVSPDMQVKEGCIVSLRS